MSTAIRVRTDDGRKTLLVCSACGYFATPGRTCPVCGEGVEYDEDEKDEQEDDDDQ